MDTGELTSNMQTVEETLDFLSSVFQKADEGQCRPDDPIVTLSTADQYDARVSIHILHCGEGGTVSFIVTMFTSSNSPCSRQLKSILACTSEMADDLGLVFSTHWL